MSTAYDKMFNYSELFNFFDSVVDSAVLSRRGDNMQIYPSNFPPCDVFIHEESKDLVLDFAVAGIPKDNLEVSVEGDHLILSIHKVDRNKEGFIRYQKGIKTSSMKRKFFIHSGKYELDKIEVSLKDGVLSVSVPAKESQKKKQIAIE